MKKSGWYCGLFAIVIGVCFCTAPCYADSELENASLARIVNVLNSLNPLIDEAQRQQDKNTRVQFQYDVLKNDLLKIKAGINAKLKQVSIEPRVVTPLQGDYLTFHGKHL